MRACVRTCQAHYTKTHDMFASSIMYELTAIHSDTGTGCVLDMYGVCTGCVRTNIPRVSWYYNSTCGVSVSMCVCECVCVCVCVCTCLSVRVCLSVCESPHFGQ